MDSETKRKYETYKMTVKVWEHDFKKQTNRIPSKYDIKDAPYKVKQAYKMYYRMKTSFLSQTLNDILDEDEEQNSAEFLEMSCNSSAFMDVSFSNSINELLDPNKKLPDYAKKQPKDASPSNEFEAVNHIATNDDAWSVKMKMKDLPKKSTEPVKKTKEPIKLTLKMIPEKVRTPRNPRKALSKTFSSQTLESDNSLKDDILPDLETILLEKSRSAKSLDVKKIEQPPQDIKTSIDSEWLSRNATESQKSTKKQETSNTPTVCASSSFGLSNLNIKPYTSSMSIASKSSVETKYHTADLSDSEYLDSNEYSKSEILPVSKKRRLSTDDDKAGDVDNKFVEVRELQEVHVPDVHVPKKTPPAKPKRKSAQIARKKPKNLPTVSSQPVHNFETDDDSDNDPTFDAQDMKNLADDTVEPVVVMKRKKSLIKRSKEGINKVTKKAVKLLGRSRAKTSEPVDNEAESEEEEINFFVDTEMKSIENVPRVSEHELKATESVFGQFALQKDAVVNPGMKLADMKIKTKKDTLRKKIESGTLNDNYVRVNLKKKVFVRGKKAFNFSRYKKTLWKKKKAESLNDMRGCDGGVLKCFTCGGIGHFAQQCKQKGDKLLPMDADVQDESPLPTLQQAAEMANEQKLLVHANRIETIPATSNEIWKAGENDNDDDDDDDIDMREFEKIEAQLGLNKENDKRIVNSVETSQKLLPCYIGHKIPKEFLEKCDFLTQSMQGKDEIQPYYQLDANGTVPSEIPKEVYDALERFGHKGFRKGQEKAIMRVLCGQSTLVTLSTGSGKSLCYQLPAYLYRQKYHCITLVISPLVSLMEDQVHGIPGFINAQCLHTNQTPKTREKVMEEIKNGNVEILLISPEAVVAGEKSTGFGSLLRQLPPIAFVCIDEAHCVSQWSHNFRPSYLMICRVLREKLGVKIVLGLTATATLQTRNSIIKHLSIPDGLNGVISDIPLPDNLVLTVSKDENRDRGLIQLLRSERFASLQSIIIYCTRRDECERIAGYLRTTMQDQNQIKDSSSNKRKRTNWVAEFYHAGMPASRRRTVQNAFMGGDLKIVVATIAFGMGINKSDIRGIIHYNMPKNFESFVQEVGRAGRDGKPAHCHVFLDSKGGDISELRRHIYANSIDRHVIRKLLQKVFVPCSCKQRIQAQQQASDQCDKNRRICPGHEVSFSKEQTVQTLDIPEENIETLLCYLELHENRYVKVLGNAYTMCKIISYSGINYMKQMAKTCPPLAMAVALELKKGKGQEDLSCIEFSVVDVASLIGWDSGVVKYQLKQLEWSVVNGMKKRSPLTVSFSDLGFRIKSPGDLTNEELDQALDSLEFRTQSQERTQVIQLQVIYDSFNSIAFPNIVKCSGSSENYEESDELKGIIRKYFQTNLPVDVEITENTDDTPDEQIIADIKQLVHMYPENNFSGRAIARIFHGISSPCYPAVIWGRCKFWRTHLMVNFHRLVRIGNREIIKSRLN